MSSPRTENLHLTRVPIADTGMLIRKPVAEVFEAHQGLALLASETNKKRMC
jgi:hypothetical protein